MELHPITVHFAVGLAFAGLVFELLGWALRRDGLRVAAWWNLLAGTLATMAAILTGRAAEAAHPHTDAIHTIMEAHETRAWIFLGLLLLILLTRAIWLGGPPFPKRRGGAWAALYLILVLAAAGTVFSGAGLGGKMVFEHGMGVMPMMEQMQMDHDHMGDEVDHAGHDHASDSMPPAETPESPAEENSSHEGHDHGSHTH